MAARRLGWHKPRQDREELDKMPLVSIIVPCHNAEKTIGRCVDSILGQKFQDFELLLLDDGSTDGSGAICDSYADADGRVRVLHKEGTGVSDTRNIGISMARGEFLQFADSDDWITPDATAFLSKSIEENGCDMVIADFYRVIGDRVSMKGSLEEDGKVSRVDYALGMMQNPADFYFGVLWNKFYRRSIIEEHGLKMDDSVSWCEDFLFNLEYIKHAEQIYVLKIPVYYYVKTKGSLVSSQGSSMKKTIQMKRRVFASYNDFYKSVFDGTEYEKKKGQVYRFLLDIAGDGSVSPIDLPKNYRLGNERTRVRDAVLDGEGIFFDTFQEGKLLEKLFSIEALRNDLAIEDMKLLYYLSQSHRDCGFSDVASILGVSRPKLSASIQRLLSRELIVEQPAERDAARDAKPGGKNRVIGREYVVAQEAEGIISELLFLLCDFEQVKFDGFSQEEIELYESLSERKMQNIKNALRE